MNHHLEEPSRKHPTTRGVFLSTPAFAVLLLLVAASWWLTGRSWFAAQQPTPRTPPADAEHGVELREGPWGALELRAITIAPPDHLLPTIPTRYETAWTFPVADAGELTAFFAGLDLTPAQRANLANPQTWTPVPEGLRLIPSDETILSLSTTNRIRIYDLLGALPANEAHRQPWSMPAALFEQALERSDLATPIQEHILRMAYPRGSRIFFSDLGALMNQTSQPSEKIKIMRFLKSAATYLVTLRLTEDVDVDAMVAYWGEEGRRKDLRPILESIRRLPGGGHLDIAHLLPAFARQRLYIYPDPELAKDGVRRDCHWTSLNFFANTPDPRFGDAEFAQQHILTHYHPVADDPDFADLLFFSLPNGDTIHSAVYLAGGLAYTKNGDSLDQPWIIMTVDEIEELYALYHHDNVTRQIWRPRETTRP
ncbi:MAG TPA: hypothetical protein PKE26_16405 [Kiritimatiellia bacterium]|nr:hypothetical protein [Kiritimatiellia bacterium]HMP00680.1 hypothetical protein [Kiritimatiellia bacterium]HMP97901.1 hypothetical protein [Kiritimatiellia bacterium]